MENFIKQLSQETAFSYEQSKQLVYKIKKYGDINTAITIYQKKGYFALIVYNFLIDKPYWRQWGINK